jgi:hypothetical protein
MEYWNDGCVSEINFPSFNHYSIIPAFHFSKSFDIDSEFEERGL